MLARVYDVRSFLWGQLDELRYEHEHRLSSLHSLSCHNPADNASQVTAVLAFLGSAWAK